MGDTILTTPRAIVLAGALLGLGVFLGLRSRAPAPGASASSGVPAPVASQARAPEQPAPGAAATARAVAAVRAALESQRAELRTKCHDALDGGSVTVMLNFSFDAQGRQLIRGMVADRDAAPAVVACLSSEPGAIEVPPPGAPVYLEVPFSLP